MTGASLTHNLDEFGAYLAALRQRLADLTPLMEEIGSELETSSSRRFETKLAPDGTPWAQLAASTIKKRIKALGGEAAGDILIFTGELSGKLSYEATGDQVTVSLGATGNATAYAAIHQFGGLAGRGHKTRIPARPVLGLSLEDEANIVAIVESFLNREAAS